MSPDNLLALDVGDRRVGVAVASMQARLPQVLTTLQRGPEFWQQLLAILDNEQIGQIVIGLPTGLNGQTTGQTDATHLFVEELKQHTDLPTSLQDEALSSVRAKEELQKRGKDYVKGDVDALAATYILEDYLHGASNG